MGSTITIHKAKLSKGYGVKTFEAPEGSQLISADFQDDRISVWYIVNTEYTDMVKRTVEIVPTGAFFKSKIGRGADLQFLGTATMTEVNQKTGKFCEVVCHVFEVINEAEDDLSVGKA